MSEIFLIPLPKLKPFTKLFHVLMTVGNKLFENIVGKGKNSGYQHFLLIPQCFLFLQKQLQSFKSQVCFGCENAFNLEQSKMVLLSNTIAMSETLATMTVRVYACVHQSEFVGAITSTTVDGFKKKMTQFFFITFRCGM